MNQKQHQEESARTFNYLKEPIPAVVGDQLHCVVGIETEAGELMDQYKRVIYYGKPLDKTNVEEELGDLMWYISNLCRLLDIDLDQVLDKNINKLKVSFPDKFSTENALNRDLTAERRELEK